MSKHPLATLLFASIAGCISYGPQTIPRDRFDYGQAIADSWEEQMVVNMLRVRYGEAPVFLDVSQVINQYALEGQVGLQGTAGGVPGVGSDAAGLEGGVRWADRPTITYLPLSGRRFAKSLLTPISPEAVFTMIESGWPADLVFAVTLRSINGIRNDFSSTTRPDNNFNSLLEVIARLQNTYAIDISIERGAQESLVHINLNKDYITPESLGDISIVRSTLKLEKNSNQFVLGYGSKSSGGNELYVQTRSMLQIMEELAYGISVPPEHVTSGKTLVSPQAADSKSAGYRVFKMHYSLEEPEDTLVAIHSRGYWFSVDDRDYASKRILAFLMIMLNLAEPEPQNSGPVITIGTGT